MSRIPTHQMSKYFCFSHSLKYQKNTKRCFSFPNLFDSFVFVLVCLLPLHQKTQLHQNKDTNPLKHQASTTKHINCHRHGFFIIKHFLQRHQRQRIPPCCQTSSRKSPRIRSLRSRTQCSRSTTSVSQILAIAKQRDSRQKHTTSSSSTIHRCFHRISRAR